MIVAALASMLVAPPLSAFAQGNPGGQSVQSVPQTGVQSAPQKGVQSAPHKGVQSAPQKGVQSAPHKGEQSAPQKGVQSAPHKGVQSAPQKGVQSAPQRSAPAAMRSHNFRGHVYHGQHAWEHGRWRHEKRNGRFGWWWDVGGIWYFYPEPIEGPPDYVSDIEVEDETAAAPPPPPEEPRQAVYYRPGDLKGIPYDTLEECTKARQQAGDVGVCVMK
jgi:hypothetical protein